MVSGSIFLMCVNFSTSCLASHHKDSNFTTGWCTNMTDCIEVLVCRGKIILNLFLNRPFFVIFLRTGKDLEFFSSHLPASSRNHAEAVPLFEP